MDGVTEKVSYSILQRSKRKLISFFFCAFSPVVDEGYGLSYSVNNRTLRFIITSMNRGPNNNVQAFRHYLEEACNDVREVVEKGMAAEGGDVKAKL
jgi:carnitine O-acetyltransferase